MATTISYKKFNLIPVMVTWFNTKSNLDQMHFNGMRIFRQSIPLTKINNKCIQQYTSVTSIIDLTQTEEQLWKAMDPKSCRYEIRKIKKLIDAGENIQIKDNVDAKGFLAIANRYINEKGYTKPLKQWQLDMYFNDGKGDLRNIYYNGQLIGGNVYIRDFPSRVRLLYSFSDRLSDSSIARLSGAFMRYLHWYAMIEKYKKEGFNGYDMGGIGTKTEAVRGIAKFKLSFGGSKVEEQNYVFVSSRLVGKLYNTYRAILTKRRKR